MKIFACGVCGQMLYFHNVQCVRCRHRLGFDPESLQLLALEQTDDGRWHAVGQSDSARYRLCGNYVQHQACNWLVPAGARNGLCVACRLNRTIPDLSVPGHADLWRTLQTEKNRLVYGLLRLGLPVIDKQEDPERGLAFDFLADPNPQFREDGSGIVIGHAGGVITLDIAEADDAVRERLRQEMAEPYRTILGHFRHESGHYYWDRLVQTSSWLQPFRERFGDERASYQDALEAHYNDGPPADWQRRFVSAYASSHPWEDWAESWAHYLHIVDTLETAHEFGLHPKPRLGATEAPAPPVDVRHSPSIEPVIEQWLPLTAALNSLNLAMGQGYAYPFVLAAPAIAKLEMVHQIVRDAGEVAR